MASKAFDSTNNIDVRKFCIDLMPEINQTFTILFPFRCSCRLGEHLAPQSPGREWDPLESLVFYSYWIWSHWKLQGINFTIKKKKSLCKKMSKFKWSLPLKWPYLQNFPASSLLQTALVTPGPWPRLAARSPSQDWVRMQLRLPPHSFCSSNFSRAMQSGQLS